MLPATKWHGILLMAACGVKRDSSLIVVSGHVEATDVRVASKIAGRLQKFSPAKEDRVAAGQELARIDDVDVRLAALTLAALRFRKRLH